MNKWVGVFVVLWASGAWGQDRLAGCYSLEGALRVVADRYQEKPEAILRSHLNGMVMILTANRETGTWTLFGQRRLNEFCIINVGDSFDKPSDKMKALRAPRS